MYKNGTIVVTGGGSGIGLATVERLVLQGAKVAMIDRDANAIGRQVKHFTGRGLPVIGVTADVTEAGSIKAAIDQAVSIFGPLYGLVNAAGISVGKVPADELSLDQWDRVMNVNLKGAFITTTAAVHAMRENHSGSIVNVASIMGHRARIGYSAYGASKAGVIMLTKILALEFASAGIRVNAVAPNATMTPMIERIIQNEGEKAVQERIYGSSEGFRPGIPLRRLAQPEAPAAAITFLLSKDAEHITGQLLLVDGGESVI